MQGRNCKTCLEKIEAWQESCGECGYHLVLEPDEARKVRYLRAPSMGALLWTQGWTFGARLYLWFLLSLVPVFGLVALFACLFYGRRWSWKYGGWDDWETFVHRMRVMDAFAVIWVLGLVIGYGWLRFSGGV